MTERILNQYFEEFTLDTSIDVIAKKLFAKNVKIFKIF